MRDMRSTSHARYDLWYHFAWSTKYRKKVFQEEDTREEIKGLSREIAGQWHIEVREVEVLVDHVHLLVSAPPRIAPARIAQILKSTSTKIMFERYPWLKKYYWGGEVWVGGYFVRSAGPGLTMEMIETYIQAQAEER